MSKATAGSSGSDVTGPPTPSAEDPDLSRDEVFEVLSTRRRRYTLHCLQQEGTTALGDISEQVAAWETGQSVEEIDAAERKRVYTSLQQFHLPKLEEKGIVDVDERSGTVALGAAAEDVDVYMEVTEKYDFPWSFYYLGLAGIGAVLVSLSWLGVPPVATVPDAGWVAFLLTTLTVSALAHTVLVSRMRLGREGPPPETER